MKLDQDTIKWIEKALGDMRHGEARLIICEGVVSKIMTEEHRLHEKTIDTNIANQVD